MDNYSVLHYIKHEINSHEQEDREKTMSATAASYSILQYIDIIKEEIPVLLENFNHYQRPPSKDIKINLKNKILPNQPSIYECNICGYKCKYNVIFQNHMLSHVDNKSDFACPSRKVKLNAHIMTDTRQKSYACSQCEYKCRGRKEILSHMDNHKGSKVLQCNECDYSCSKLSVLTRHLHAHAHEKSFKCAHCEFRCIQKGSLRTHLMTHTGEKPFACNFCQYRCIRRSDLINHERIHTKRTTLACNDCDYKTVNRTTLKIHMYTHTGEKPYECIKCDYRCARRGYLEKHMLIHYIC